MAEWANFVALGVFAYHVGGTLAVGIAGLVRLLPAALVAPFAAFVGDRFRRERFLVAISAGGCLALAGSAAVSWGTQTQSRTESVDLQEDRISAPHAFLVANVVLPFVSS